MVGKKWKGRTIKANLQIDGQPLLLAGDRLEPSQQLMDVGALHVVPLPLTVVFWRVSRLEDQVTDAVHHRCPLFCEELHTDPVGTIVVDTLHTLYYGPIMRWTSAALHRIVAANPWCVRGTPAKIRDICMKRLSADAQSYFELHNIPHDRRVTDITPKMIGAAGANSIDHKGCLMKVKAAETSILMGFALHALKTHNLNQPQLTAAGEALSTYLLVMHSADAVPSNTDCRLLMDHMITHLVLCEGAHVHYAPKHHLCVEMTYRKYLDGSL